VIGLGAWNTPDLNWWWTWWFRSLYTREVRHQRHVTNLE